MLPIVKYNISELEVIARKLRRHVINMISAAGSGHPGGSLSAADIVTALYFDIMKHNPANPHWPDRDRFILSKGHAAPVLYAALAECGYFPLDWLTTLRKTGTCLQGHTDSTLTPGVDVSAGSLGQGLSIADGMALGARLNNSSSRTYCLMGDGETNEGQVWEAAMLASHYKLDNVMAFVDRNKLQIDGTTESIMSLEPLADKWKAFGWNVLEIDGHNMRQILDAANRAKETKGRPTMVIAHTIKGKGVSFMENNLGFHGKSPTADETRRALRELGEDQ